MEARDGKIQPVVEAVRAEPVRAGIEMELGAALLPRQCFHPPHQGFCVALSAMALERNEIIDIKRLSPGEPFGDAKASCRDRLVTVFDVNETPAGLLLLPLGARDELVCRNDMGTQRLDDGIEATDIGFADRLFDQHLAHLCVPSASFTAAPALAKSIWPAKRCLSAPMTLPMSLRDAAPVSAMTFSIAAFASSGDICFGMNSRMTLISARSALASSGRPPPS